MEGGRRGGEEKEREIKKVGRRGRKGEEERRRLMVWLVFSPPFFL